MAAFRDLQPFGPWALITGASSGLGREYARQIAASGLHVVLAARREDRLRTLGRELSAACGVEHRVVVADLSAEGFIQDLAAATADLEIGLVVSNAGTGRPGEFISGDRDRMRQLLRLNTLAHMEIARQYLPAMARRGRGGILFVGAMGADHGIPYMANDAGAKAYVQSFAEGLHVELRPRGVHVTVMPVGPTDTEVLPRMGFDPRRMPLRPMTVQQPVAESLAALRKNRSRVVPGALNRLLVRLVPAAVVRRLMARMFQKTLGKAPAPARS